MAQHGVDHAAELDENSVAGALDDTPVMSGDGGIDQIAAQPPEARQGTIFGGAGEPAIADDVGDQNRRNLAGFAHSSGSPAFRKPSNTGGRFGVCAIIHFTVSLGLRRRASAKAVFASSILPFSA